MRANFKLTPKGIIESLNLRRPIYRKTAAYGHFGRNDPDFTWESDRQGRGPARAGRACRREGAEDGAGGEVGLEQGGTTDPVAASG